MISSFVYLCAWIFEKTHLDLDTCQKTHYFIYGCVETNSSYLQDKSAWLVMANWGAIKDLKPSITWCPIRRKRRRRRRFNLPMAKVCLDQYFVTSHCWRPLQIRGIESHLGKMLALHYQNQRCVRSTFCLKCVDMDFVAET